MTMMTLTWFFKWFREVCPLPWQSLDKGSSFATFWTLLNLPEGSPVLWRLPHAMQDVKREHVHQLEGSGWCGKVWDMRSLMNPWWFHDDLIFAYILRSYSRMSSWALEWRDHRGSWAFLSTLQVPVGFDRLVLQIRPCTVPFSFYDRGFFLHAVANLKCDGFQQEIPLIVADLKIIKVVYSVQLPLVATTGPGSSLIKVTELALLV